jgi:AcrR family transcriptional regulator
LENYFYRCGGCDGAMPATLCPLPDITADLSKDSSAMKLATPDRRTLKTRAALLAAFRDLLLERGYDGVQVGDVSDRADVGRSTFYEHFSAKSALLRASLAVPFNHMAAIVLPPASPQDIIPWLLHFRDHQQVVRMLLGWPTRPILSQVLTEAIAQRLPQGQDITARLIADAQLALLDIWILGRPACTVDEAAAILRSSSAALAVAAGAMG